jgi:DNA (cytosine-5)-methyltransferase 1
MEQDPQLLVIDLFCGAGGVTTGFAQAIKNKKKLAYIIGCVNHDWKAIRSHWRNHPNVEHFNEDITKLYGELISGVLFKSNEFRRLVRMVDIYRALYPDAKVILWASLECTNFSNAKGGMARDADSRTLAEHLDRYVIAIDPDYIQIENVREFKEWGPLDEKGKPIKHLKGVDFKRWNLHIESLGYVSDWKMLNSADFGAYTSRNRLFGIFARPGMPILWPEPTHVKSPEEHPGRQLEKWRAVKDVLQFDLEGESIFTRKKPLVDATLERVYAGLVKFVANGDVAFISKYFSGKPSDKNIPLSGPAGTIKTRDGQALVQAAFLTKNYSGKPDGKNISVSGPAGTITTFGGSHALVQPKFLVKYNSRAKDGSYNPPSIEDPSPVISTQNRLYLAQPEFLTHYYSGGGQTSSIDDPCPTITAMDGKALVQPEYFIDKQYGKGQNQSIDSPAGTVMPNDKHALVKAEPFIMPTNYDNGPRSIHEPAPTITANRKHHYLINPSWGGNPGSVDLPCCVIVARQDKAPLYFVQVEYGAVSVAVYVEDSPVMIKIKQFMAAFNIVDIKMRMLSVLELLDIQGFPKGYYLDGSQADKKKFIGNSVVPLVVRLWTEALAATLKQYQSKKTA